MFTSTFGAVILASFLACVVTTIGMYIISKYEIWGNRNALYFISFAAGLWMRKVPYNPQRVQSALAESFNPGGF